MKNLFLIVVVFIPFSAVAHPHVFIDNRVSVLFNGKELKGFEFEWAFDEMFSSTLIQDFDVNADGKFSKEEIKSLKEGAFSNLKKHNYFSDITVEGKCFEVKEIGRFFANIDSGIVYYKFLIPCEVVVSQESKEIEIAVYDPTYFVQILWAPREPFCFKNTSNIKIGYEVFEDEEKAYYYGQIVPEVLKMNFKRKR